tara:strand:+ start:5250 stop:6509 length:1260 start_codon:yes stop_codon:yes gene_type:complete
MQALEILTKGVEDTVCTLSPSINEEASMISCFNSIKDPNVLGEIEICDFIECIKNPDQQTKMLINKARSHKAKGQLEEYDKIKEKLPCFTLNFSFQNRKNNESIKSPTGLIYIDVDNTLDIDFDNDLIFASWKSLSGLGRGILVRVEGLTIENFKSTYLDIAKTINIEADEYAGKATQYNVHSYDEDIYINEESFIWHAIEEIKNTPSALIYKKKKRKDIKKLGVNDKWQYNNISDLDFGDNDFLFFPDKKETIAQAYLPFRKIELGARNHIISVFAYQMRALNPEQPVERFVRYILNVNNARCYEPLGEKEVLAIVSKVLKEENSEPIYNKPRRIIFNPKCKLSKKEKMAICNKHLGLLRIQKTKSEIKECLDKWNFYKMGKVTQKKLAQVTGKNIKTIERYYKDFKNEILIINKQKT